MIVMPLLGISGTANLFTVSLTDLTIIGTAATPADAQAAFRLDADSKIYRARSQVAAGAYVEIEGPQWLDPHDDFEADNYECFATLNSGTLTSGTTGSWLSLDTDREWVLQRTSDTPGTDTVDLTIGIRRIGTTANLASAGIILTAEVT